MSLEGLRAWIGEVERKLGKRTRVFLVLSVIAIGLGAAATYLAIDARESSVSESDVQALQEKLERRIDEVSARGTAELEPPGGPEATPAPQPETTPEGGNQGKGGSSGGTSGGSAGGAGGSIPGSATGGAANSAELQELLRRAKERPVENE
jgi:hypothetical protein